MSDNLDDLHHDGRASTGIRLALAVTWLTAGANFLGFKIAVSALPPFLMMSLRTGAAGILLLLALMVFERALPRPSLRQTRDACISGLLFLVLGQGLIVVGVQHVSAGYAALLAATAPLMTALVAWICGGSRPSGPALAGILSGFAGLSLLVAPSLGTPAASAGSALILVGALAWGGAVRQSW